MLLCHPNQRHCDKVCVFGHQLLERNQMEKYKWKVMISTLKLED